MPARASDGAFRTVMELSGHGDVLAIPTHLTMFEKRLLYRLAKSLPSGAVVVEIGSYLGASTSLLAAGVKKSGGQVWAVDTWANDAMSEGPRDTYDDFLRNTALLKAWIMPIRSRSEDAAGGFGERIDLLFVDGDHAYEAVRRDLELWLPKVKSGGTVVLHDYGWAEGVQRATQELLVPVQAGAGRSSDNIYWARIGAGGAQGR